MGGIAATQKYVLIGDRDLMDQNDVLRCYSAVDGEPLWTFSFPAPGYLDYGNTPRATPLIDKDRVYLQGAFGNLYCVALDTGRIVWTKNYKIEFGATAELAWGTCASPLIVDNKLIINPGAPDASIVALDPKDARVLWKTPGDIPAFGSFVAGKLGGVQQVIGHDDESLGGWEVATGKRIWKYIPNIDDDFNVPMPMIYGDKLLVTSENNATRLYQFGDNGIIDPEPVSVNDDLASDIATPIIVGDRAYCCWGELFCLDLKDDLATRWSVSEKSYSVYGSIIAYGERLLVVGASGELILVNAVADQYEEVSRLSIFDNPDAELYSHPAMVGSRLYMRGENELVCVELRGEE